MNWITGKAQSLEGKSHGIEGNSYCNWIKLPLQLYGWIALSTIKAFFETRLEMTTIEGIILARMDIEWKYD